MRGDWKALRFTGPLCGERKASRTDFCRCCISRHKQLKEMADRIKHAWNDTALNLVGPGPFCDISSVHQHCIKLLPQKLHKSGDFSIKPTIVARKVWFNRRSTNTSRSWSLWERLELAILMVNRHAYIEF